MLPERLRLLELLVFELADMLDDTLIELSVAPNDWTHAKSEDIRKRLRRKLAEYIDNFACSGDTQDSLLSESPCEMPDDYRIDLWFPEFREPTWEREDKGTTTMKDIYAIIGQNVRRIRQERLISQSDLAEGVGFLRTSVSNIESGKQRIPLHTLIKIADALGVSPGQLLPAEWWPETDRAKVWELQERIAGTRCMLQEIIEEL